MKSFLIPVLAFVSAIGMSFTALTQQNPNHDYIQREEGQWEEIQEVNCPSTGPSNCQVLLNGEGPFTVYDEMNNESSVKPGSGTPIILP